MRFTAVCTRFFHASSLLSLAVHVIDVLGIFGADEFKTGCGSDPIHVIQDLPVLLPTITRGITRTDTSSGENENDAKRTGPVPFPCTVFVTAKPSNCFCHQ